MQKRFVFSEEWEKALRETTGWVRRGLGPIRFGRAPVQLQLP